jgi:hypothetical protein
VGAYIEAINAQDPSILAAIATPGLAQSTVDGWFGTTIEEVQIDAALDGTQLAIGTEYEGKTMPGSTSTPSFITPTDPYLRASSPVGATTSPGTNPRRVGTSGPRDRPRA